ncbi:MAG: cytochrome oxidase subunit [Paucimonas sp.]|nr:cytochrome oxidase subunit [Paucimonas sp.]
MLIQLALKGLLVALLPLSFVWASKDADKYRKLAWVTVFLTFDLVMFGAFTRLTDSGLGCPDWPGCYGEANPLQAHAQISAAEAAMPTGPVTVAKAWIEMIHRYMAMAVGVLIIALLAVAWRKWRQSGRSDARFAPGFPLLLLGFVCLQGAFGAWTVTLKLQPVVVTMHLLLGISLLALLTWLASRQEVAAVPVISAPGLCLPAALSLLVLFMQIGLGGWVSTNYATLACADFPLCHGQLLPDMDFSNGFHLWRELGMTATGEYLPVNALTAIHWVHRSFAVVVLAVVGYTAHRALREPGLQRVARGLLIVLGVQLLTGASTVFLSWPLALAVLHNGGAALMAILLVVLNFRLKTGSASRASHLSARPTPV